MAVNNDEHSIQTDDYKIIIDEPARNVPDFREHAERLSKIIVRSKPQFTVGIFGGWGTGKTTMMQMISDEIKERYSGVATTIWFDSWRYEREKYTLMIPLLRTIIIRLYEIIKSGLIGDEKRNTLKRFQVGLVKMIKAVAAGAGVNLGVDLGTPGSQVSAGATLDFAKILNEISKEREVDYNQEKIYFHKHVSEYLKEELEGIKTKHRLVIFIDDLDRCTPEGTLEILESIKTFFDIEGIIYVIGMDPTTIDSIIQVKYGKNPKISGLDYMQKIVQLPFQIPVWSSEDLGRTIIEFANETGLPKEITYKMLGKEIQNLIINSSKLNPRNIKRFINALVLSYSTSGKNIQEIHNENLRNYIIENYLRGMIAVQTFYFRGEQWLRFLKMINNYHERIDFLTHFITVVKEGNISFQDLCDKIKEFPSKTYEIYNEIIEINDEELFTFLQEASISLLKIDKIENYLRAIDSKNIEITRNTGIKSYESVDKLAKGINSFNEYVRESKIHLPYLNIYEIFKWNTPGSLSWANLPWAKLSEANLCNANLLHANLSRADLSRADLAHANLSRADLSGCNLSKAKLSFADLSGCNLSVPGFYISSEGKYSAANLSRADLLGANLLHANLSRANLSRANLSRANLSRANLSGANLSGADVSYAILIGIEPQNYKSMTLNTKSNFEHAICDNVDFIYYISRFIAPEHIPSIMDNKNELKLELEKRKYDKQEWMSTLEISKLPDRN